VQQVGVKIYIFTEFMLDARRTEFCKYLCNAVIIG